MTPIKSRAQLADLKRKLQVGGAAVSPRVARRVAGAFSSNAQRAFDAQQSVYGGSTFGGRTFVKTGKLRSLALAYSAIGNVVRASLSAVRYAKYYIRFGILPRKGSRPAAWEQDARAIAREELTREFGARP